jgi:hypothetical protein
LVQARLISTASTISNQQSSIVIPFPAMRLLLVSSFLILVSSFPRSGHAQTTSVLKDKNNRLIDSLKVPSGKTFTIESGATITNSGSATGFGGAWGSITGTLASQTDLQTALNAKASTASLSSYLTTATAASTYSPLAGSASITTIGTLAAGAVPTTLLTGQLTSAQLPSNIEISGSMVVGGANGSRMNCYDRAITHSHGPTGRAGILFFPNFANVTGSRTYLLPDNGTTSTQTIVTQSDTGTVTNAMLAGSIALSNLAITGTPDGTKFIRDDGSYQAINLSGYLPLTGGTLTGGLTLTGGTVTASTPMLTQTQIWNAGGTTFRGVEIAHTVTSAAAAATHLRIRGGSGGTTDRLTLTEDKMVVNGAEAAGRVFDLVSQYGTTPFNVAGGGTLTINNSLTSVASSGEIRSSIVNNGSFFCGIGFEQTPNVAYIRPFGTGATTLQIGVSAASPIAHTVRGASARAGTDTNTAGAPLTIAGGNGTGTGAGGDVITVTSMSGSSGTSANTTQERSRVIGRFVNLTEGTATNVASISLASGKVLGGSATITVWAADGTDYQALTSQVRFSAVNKAGTITASASQTNAAIATASAGTLTVTYDTSTNGNNVLLRANATSSLTETTLRARLVITALNGDDLQTVTPQ